MKNLSRALGISLLLVGACGLAETARADVMFSGDTNSSSFAAPPLVGLTFTGASFSNVSVPLGPGPTSLTNLGTFTASLVCSSNNCTDSYGTQDGTTDFTLRINFTDPTVSGSPELFAADIYGQIVRSGASSNFKSGTLLTINFDNTVQHLTYSNASGTGAFDLSVNDPSAFTSADSSGATRTVTGQITNLTFTPSSFPPSEVPEPGSIGLLLTAIGGVAFSLYRRRRV